MKGAFLYVDAGKGHYVPAVALADALKDMGGEAVVEDLFITFKSPIFRWFAKNVWRSMLHHPKLEWYWTKSSDNELNRKFVEKAYSTDRILLKNFKTWFEREKPDFIVSTNFFGAAILPKVIKKLGYECPVYDYVADLFDQCVIGLNPELDKVYVPTEIGRKHTIAMGQPAETVALSPFPLSKKFDVCEKLSREEARKKLGLKEKFTVLMNLGGEGIGSPEILYGMVKRNLDVQVVVIGGKSKSTAAAFEAFQKEHPDFDLVMAGFVNNAYDYIMAANMQMGKAGANSLMESLYLKTPFLVSEVLFMARSTPLFFQEYSVGWCENDL